MSVVKRLLDWNQKKFDEIDVENDKHWQAKSFASGAIEGFVDASVVLFPVMVAATYYWRKKFENK